MKTFCCICREAKDDNGWTRITLKDSRGRVHGLCKECYDRAMAITMEEYGGCCLIDVPLGSEPGKLTIAA